MRSEELNHFLLESDLNPPAIQHRQPEHFGQTVKIVSRSSGWRLGSDSLEIAGYPSRLFWFQHLRFTCNLLEKKLQERSYLLWR
jgi:hypothetical protein